MVNLDCASAALEKQYYKLGKLIGRKPLPFIIIPSLITMFSLTGFLRFEVINDMEYFYTPINGESKQERAHFKEMFPEDHSSKFIASRRNVLDGFVQVILSDDSHTNNIWTKDHFETVLFIDNTIQSITCSYLNSNFTYSDICAKWNGSCSTTNPLLEIFNKTAVNIVAVPVTYPIHDDQYFIGSSLGGVILQNNNNSIITKAKSVMLTYYVKYIESTDIKISDEWLTRVKEYLKPLTSLNGLSVVFQTSLSLNEELAATTLLLFPTFAIAYVVLLSFSVLSCVMLDCVRSKPWVAVAGEASAAMAVATAMGLLMACKVPFPETVAMMPFLVIGIGIDDMFVMLSCWRHSSCSLNTEERMGQTLKTAATSITITSITDALAFAAGCISSFRSVIFFGVYTVVAVCLSYVYAVTFLAACMVYSGRREEKNKHAITLRPIIPKYKSGGRSLLYRLCCTGGTDNDENLTPEELQNRVLPLATKFYRDVYTPFIIKMPVKIITLFLYAVYIVIAIWGCFSLTEGIKTKELVSSGSYLVDFHNILDTNFAPNYGPRIMVSFKDSLNYSDAHVKNSVISTIQSFQKSDMLFSTSNMTESWIISFDDYLKSTNQSVGTMQELISVLQMSFLQLTNYTKFESDIVFNDAKTEIIESRFLIQSLSVTDSVEEKNLMLEARQIAKQSLFNITVYHPNFIFYDQYTVIVSNTIQAIAVAVVSIFLVAIVLLPNVLTIIMVIVSVASILIGVIGYMVWWSVPLNSLTTIYLTMSTGFSVDFTAHLCYHFASSKEQDPNERTKEALAYLGHPIAQAAISTILGVLLLAPSDSFIFIYFFKIVFLVMLIGFLHGVLYLPVILALIGSICNTVCASKAEKMPTIKRTSTVVTNNVREGWI